MLTHLIQALEIAHSLMTDESLSINDVVDRISDMGNIPKERILGRSREENVVFLRLGAYYVYRKRFDLSYPSIAELTNRKDHTTVMHGVRTIENGFDVYVFRIS